VQQRKHFCPIKLLASIQEIQLHYKAHAFNLRAQESASISVAKPRMAWAYKNTEREKVGINC
jgi:hypothetical protein